MVVLVHIQYIHILQSLLQTGDGTNDKTYLILIFAKLSGYKWSKYAMFTVHER
jgi:hypothetical protein